ncbi:MAG: hypothetical protein ACRD6X_07695 [Pyrinomonadaceae bacterium]
MLIAIAMFGFLFFSAELTVRAQTTTFAQFFERNGTQDFVLTNNTSSADFNAVGGGSPIFFIYSNITGLDPSLQGIQSAHLFLTTTTTQSGVSSGGSVTQPLNQTVTIQIIRDAPAPVGVGFGSRTNLLTAVFSPAGNTPGVVGSDGGNSATMSATTPDHTVTFSSEFLLFGLTTQRNLALSFSSVAPSFALGSGSFLQNFEAAASGTFASSPPPIPFTITAASVSVSGRVLDGRGFGLGKSAVVLTESNGTRHLARTSTFGYFSFEGIQDGQSVIVSVESKRFSFSPRILSLTDNVSDLVFTPDF